MTTLLALNIPQSGPKVSPSTVALIDVIAGIRANEMWGRLGWRENKRRYRRTVFGPFWTTVSLAIFVVALGLVWSNLWHKDPKQYLPFLTSGMLCWVLLATICNEGCNAFVGAEAIIKQLRISYTLLACATVWRNVVVFFHNFCVYVLIFIYAGLSLTWSNLLVIPGLLLLCINGLWIAIALGVMCARYRDVQQLVTNLLQIALFLTPIFWSSDQLNGRASILADYNPLYHLISVARDPMLGKAPALEHWVAAGLLAVFGWALAIYLLTKLRHRIVYWL